jgi:hypothetical protein
MSFEKVLLEAGYACSRQLADGNWLAVQRQMYTTGLFLIRDGDEWGYECRWCYEHTVPAIIALNLWNGIGDDPPGPWVKQKGRNSTGRGVDRLNPKLADEKAEF